MSINPKLFMSNPRTSFFIIILYFFKKNNIFS
nr:MAG TPA: hypothetical protein [Caudoviricetes sp.]